MRQENELVALRMSTGTRTLIQVAAAERGESLSEFLRRAGRVAAVLELADTATEEA